MTSDLAWGSIADLTAMLLDGRVSAAEFLDAELGRIGALANSLPAGLDRSGLPIGIRLGAARWRDSRGAAIARAAEPIAGGFVRPPAFA